MKISINSIKRVSVVLLLALVLSTNSSFALSSEVTYDVNEVYMLESSIKTLENELDVNGTDVVSELNKMLLEYKSYLSSSDYNDTEKINIKEIIHNLENQISEYQNSENGIYPAGKYHPVYSKAVIAVIAYFNSKGYSLASELLLHAKNFNGGSLVYSPVRGRKVILSPVFRKIKNGTKYSGSDEFPNSGTKDQRDLYYAIKKFSWKRVGRQIILEDRYDFAFGKYRGIQGIAVNTMFLAEKAGVITPFFIRIVQ